MDEEPEQQPRNGDKREAEAIDQSGRGNQPVMGGDLGVETAIDCDTCHFKGEKSHDDDDDGHQKPMSGPAPVQFEVGHQQREQQHEAHEKIDLGGGQEIHRRDVPSCRRAGDGQACEESRTALGDRVQDGRRGVTAASSRRGSRTFDVCLVKG